MRTDLFSRHLEDFIRETRLLGERAALARATAVVLLLITATAVVYVTGGTMHVYPHLMYFAVVLAGMSFGRAVGAVVGVAAGLLVGPLMPLNVAAGVAQPTPGWMVRMAFFVGIGVLAGYARHRFNRLLDKRRTFTSSVSHELRTPLAAVVGFAEVLDRDWDLLGEDEKLELVGHIRRESFEVAQVIDDLLVAARIDGGRLHIECEETDLKRLADATLAGLGPKWDAAAVEVFGSAVSWADPLRVRQILRNLITNAISHGGERIVVELSTSGETARVEVRDNGPGVPEPVLPRLFEPFANHAVPSTMPQSVGLGLAVSRELARRMGGGLSYSRVGDQTAFTLELPMGPVEARAVQTVVTSG